MSLQVVSTVRRDNVQFFTKRRFSALFWLTRTSPGANFHIGGRVCMQLFTYEVMSEIIGLTHAKDCHVYVMSMRNFKHITPCLSHNFPQVHSKQSTTSRLFNWWTLLTMQLLTYKDVSVCKLSHMRTCLFATCHKISTFYIDHHVSAQCVDYPDVFMFARTCPCACFHTGERVCM